MSKMCNELKCAIQSTVDLININICLMNSEQICGMTLTWSTTENMNDFHYNNVTIAETNLKMVSIYIKKTHQQKMILAI